MRRAQDSAGASEASCESDVSVPPRRLCSEMRMVETESMGDHFSLRISMVGRRQSVSRCSSSSAEAAVLRRTQADVAVEVNVGVCG